MKTVRILSLLAVGAFVGVWVSPKLPLFAGKVTGVLEKIRARNRAPSAASMSSVPMRPAALPSPQPVSGLKPAEAVEIARLLGSEAGGIPAEATPIKMSRVLEQTRGRMAVTEPRKTASPERPWVAEWLPDNVAYWRVRNLSPALAEAIGRDWAVWRQKNPLGAVLDLRECLPSQSLEAVAEVCGLFVTPGEVLFTWKDGAGREKVFRSDRQPLGLGLSTPLIVLVGPNLRGAGELVASILQERGGGILLGQSTAGQLGWLAETRLSSGRSLFRMQGEIVLPGGQTETGRPLPADVDLAGGGFVDTEIWPGGEATIASTVAEVPPIKRPNEASLMKEEEIDLEEYIPTTGTAKESEVKRPPQDRGLQRAGDLLRAIRKVPPTRRAAFDRSLFRGQIRASSI
jgi:hypothetical protein